MTIKILVLFSRIKNQNTHKKIDKLLAFLSRSGLLKAKKKHFAPTEPSLPLIPGNQNTLYYPDFLDVNEIF